MSLFKITFSLQFLVFSFDLGTVCNENDKWCQNPNIQLIGNITHGKCGNFPALRRLLNVDFLKCVLECKVTSNCNSISYRRVWKICDLHKDDSEDELLNEKECTFTLISTWPRVSKFIFFIFYKKNNNNKIYLTAVKTGKQCTKF